MNNFVKVLDLARSGRAARAGTRVARVARLILANIAVWKKIMDENYLSSEENEDHELKVGKLILQIISHRVCRRLFSPASCVEYDEYFCMII